MQRQVPIKKCFGSSWCELDQVCRCEAYADAGGDRKPLSEGERQVWEFVLRFEQGCGFTPTYAEIAKELGYTNHGEQTIATMVQNMIGKHYFRLDRAKKTRKIIIIAG